MAKWRKRSEAVLTPAIELAKMNTKTESAYRTELVDPDADEDEEEGDDDKDQPGSTSNGGQGVKTNTGAKRKAKRAPRIRTVVSVSEV